MEIINSNKIYDIIVVGADLAGTSVIKELVKKNIEASKSILWISKDFSADASALLTEYPAIAYYKTTVTILDYFRQLLVISTAAGGPKFFGMKLIVCAGSTGKTDNFFNLKTNNIIFYNPSKPYSSLINKAEMKGKTLLVVSNVNKEIVQECLKLKKVFGKIVILNPKFDCVLPEDLQKKLLAANKIVNIIPSCHLKDIKLTINGLNCVLDTYTEIVVDQVLVDNTRLPDLAQFKSPLIKLDQNGYAVCNKNCESELLSTVYIINEPVKNKKELTENINTIITKILD